jgi:hypothetical protein
MIVLHYPYKPPSGLMIRRDMNTVTDFIIHHSAGPDTQTPGEIDDFERSRGDYFMPYNWLAYKTGEVYAGRDTDYVSAASYGRNAQSVAVCCVGNYDLNEPDPNIIKLVVALRLLVQGHIPTLERTYGHGDIAAKFYPDATADYATACPGKLLEAHLADIRAQVSKALVH